jgi:hypothetical protein
MRDDESDRVLRVYVQVGKRRLQCVAESQGAPYRWTGTTFSETWSGPEGQIMLEFERRGRRGPKH